MYLDTQDTHAAYSLEVFTSDLLVTPKVLVEHNKNRSKDREQGAEAEDNNVSNSLTQRPAMRMKAKGKRMRDGFMEW